MKYLIYIMSLLFVISIAMADNTDKTKAEVKQNNEAVAMDKNTCKGHKGYRHNCESKREECKKSKSCEYKCDKANEDCKKGECCKGKSQCDKSNKTVKEHKCGVGKCGVSKCGGDKASEDIKEEKSN